MMMMMIMIFDITFFLSAAEGCPENTREDQQTIPKSRDRKDSKTVTDSN